MDLGAIQSKIEHVANALLAPKIAQNLLFFILAKGVHATTAIEGNTLSEEQVRNRIAKKTSLPESQAYLDKEVDNIVEACNAIGKDIFGGKDARLTVEGIKGFNRKVLEGLPLDEACIPGEFRKYSVGVAQIPRRAVGGLRIPGRPLMPMAQRRAAAAGREIATGFAVIKAILAPSLHRLDSPFRRWKWPDGRLVEFQILLSGGAPSIAAHC